MNSSWLRRTRERVEIVAAQIFTPSGSFSPNTAVPPRQSHLERIKLSPFSGSVEDWPEFKRVFRDLVASARYTDSCYLQQLRAQIPAVACSLIAGVTSVSEAWELLDERYGDMRIGILTVQKRLTHLSLRRGPNHEQLEELVVEVRRASATLTAVGAPEAFSGSWTATTR